VEATWDEVASNEHLFHGTSVIAAEKILTSIGVHAAARTHVHLAPAVDSKVGKRFSFDILLAIDPVKLRAAGERVFRAPNGALLTRRVPKEAVVGVQAASRGGEEALAALTALLTTERAPIRVRRNVYLTATWRSRDPPRGGEMTSMKPRVWTLVVAALAVLVLEGAVGIVMVVVASSVKAVSSSPTDLARLFTDPLLLAALFAINTVLLLAVSFTGAHFSAERWRRRLAIPSLRAPPIDVVLLVIGTLGVGAVASTISQRLGAYDDSTIKVMRDSLLAASPSVAVLLAVFGSLGGVGEEIFCRGYLQTRLIARAGPAVGVVVSALFFGALHMDLVHGTFAFFVGVLIGVVAWRTQSIMTGLYAHGVNNLIAFTTPRFLEADAPTTSWELLIGVVALALACAGLWLRLKRLPPVEQSVLPPPRKGQGVKVAIAGTAGCGCLSVVVVGAFLFASVMAMRGMQDSLPPDKTAELMDAVMKFVPTADQRACVEEAFDVRRRCEDAKDSACTTQANAFLAACLRRADPTPGFCDDVPTPTDVGGNMKFANDTCSKLKDVDGATCAMVVREIPTFCHGG
jgi:membrane protease YdiL (CAAX protease family)